MNVAIVANGLSTFSTFLSPANTHYKCDYHLVTSMAGNVYSEMVCGEYGNVGRLVRIGQANDRLRTRIDFLNIF